jgi:DNA ligase (NAD+)
MQVTQFLQRLKKLSTDDLLSIKGIGETLAKNYENFISSKRYQLLSTNFMEMEEVGFELNIQNTIIKYENNNLPFSGQVICITGVFELSRNEIKEKLEIKGAKVVDSVTNTTTLLLAGDKAGSKLEKAKKLNIKIVKTLEEIL